MTKPAATVEHPGIAIKDRLRLVLDWKAILFSLVGVGAFGSAALYSVATKAEVSQEHEYNASQRAAIKGDIGEMRRHLDAIDEGNRWRDSTLKAIADKLGVYAPPPPAQP